MFVHVVRARSFAEASRRLNVPSNTLSRRVRQLETTLGTRLMQRSTRKLTLTAAGHAFFDRCAAAVDGMQAAGKELADGSQRLSGTVRIAAPVDFLDLFTIEWVAEFLRLHPEVRLDFVLSDARADLIAESIDIAFRGGGPRDNQPVFRQVMSQQAQLVASPKYLAARGAPRGLQDLVQHDCLTVSGVQRRIAWVLQGPHGREEVKVTGRVSVNSVRGLMKSCVAGLGIALLPNLVIVPDLRAGRLLRVLPAYHRAGADMNILLPSQQHVPAAVSAFLEFATDHLRSMILDLSH